jgi:hypothetical protein
VSPAVASRMIALRMVSSATFVLDTPVDSTQNFGTDVVPEPHMTL